jgi:hypothetical protein
VNAHKAYNTLLLFAQVEAADNVIEDVQIAEEFDENDIIAESNEIGEASEEFN